ncbi:MAG: hypothetical protein ACREAJ_03085 [Nitrosopumilaceae archaeon]
MSQQLDDEGKLVSMLMEANKYVRYAAICDNDGKILWSSYRNGVKNILTLEETKSTLKRALNTWKTRDELSAKIGKGRFAIVGYDKIKRITVPLRNEHMLFLSVEGDKPEYIKDILNVVKWVEEHPSQV